MKMWFVLVTLLLLKLADDDATCFAFMVSRPHYQHPLLPLEARRRTSSDTGFGDDDDDNNNNSNNSNKNGDAPAKTYGQTAFDDDAIHMDTEAAAMTDFFRTRQDWLPLFRCMAAADAATCPASRYLTEFLHLHTLDDNDNDCVSSWSSPPWQRLEAIPHPLSERDQQFWATFLDSMHQSLLEIPVTPTVGTAEDENDLQFLEEGRRMLAINRFQVVRAAQDSSSSRYERLFETCWSELMELTSLDQEHTGSLILFPESNLSDLRRFAELNLSRPLKWLGRHDFEVAAMVRGEPAIRLIYRLQDMPDIPDDPSAYANSDSDREWE